MRNKLLLLLFLLFLALPCSDIEAKEVGDIRYSPLSTLWGSTDDYDFVFVDMFGNIKYENIGHALVYIGTDENEKDWYIEAWKPKVSMSTDENRKGGPAPLDPDFYQRVLGDGVEMVDIFLFYDTALLICQTPSISPTTYRLTETISWHCAHTRRRLFDLEGYFFYV